MVSPPGFVEELRGHYRERYGLEVQLLPTVALQPSMIDPSRHQLQAKDLIQLDEAAKSRPDKRYVGYCDRAHDSGHDFSRLQAICVERSGGTFRGYFELPDESHKLRRSPR